MNLSHTEENYLKAIYHLEIDNNISINTNLIAEKLNTKASSVTDMIKKLAQKELLNYEKYKGVSLSNEGRMYALKVIRKHRLWESFLVEKLNFNWDEVHDIAEQLEHIKSNELINRIDEFLGFPSHDPHGDPIPDKNGKIIQRQNLLLSEFKVDSKCIVIGVKDSSTSFLQYLEKNEITLGSEIIIKSKEVFDNSLIIKNKNKQINISNQIANNLIVKAI